VTPKVTVLMPVYAGASYVGRAVESVLQQTYHDFELLVVDDCSPDDSADIAASYDDDRVRIARNERNLGQVASLNRGLREARAPLVARLDQDDECLPTRLERQVAVLEAESRVAVVGTWMDAVQEDGSVYDRLRGTIDDRTELVAHILAHTLPLAHPTVMFRVDRVLDVGGYDESVRYAEDMDLWRRLTLAGNDARVVHEPLLRYLVHGAQQSQRHSDEQRENNMASLDRFIAELAPGIPVQDVRRLLTNDPEFWRGRNVRVRAQRSAAALEPLVSGAAERLELDAVEAARLDDLVRARVHHVALSSWQHSVGGHWSASGPLLRSAGARRVLVYTTAPALRSARLLAKKAARVPALNRLKKHAQRSRRLLHLTR
jgi:glycosyltransferase involved in cell wall biosynthesis